MKRFTFVSVLLLVTAISGVAFGWGTSGGDGSSYVQLQETAVFYNNSGSSMAAGEAVILDSSGTAGSTLGAYVTTPGTADADSILFMGIVKTAANASSPVVVVTRGPVDALASDSGDAITTLTAVGCSSSTSGYIGGGNYAGVALEAGDGTDTGNCFIWVNPENQ